jgi:hypothetical protein
MDAANAKAARFYQHEGLNLLDQGFHPWTGIAVHFYGWNVVRKRAS